VPTDYREQEAEPNVALVSDAAQSEDSNELNAIMQNADQRASSTDANVTTDNSGQEAEPNVINDSDDSNRGLLDYVVSSSESEEGNIENEVPDVDEEEETELSVELADWATKNKITRSALTELLATLKSHGHGELPKDKRTLLKMPRKINTIMKCGGQYCYFVIETGIISILEKTRPFTYNSIIVKINIDSLPLFKSSTTQLWPILGQINSM
jgi:hypothetical protein